MTLKEAAVIGIAVAMLAGCGGSSGGDSGGGGSAGSGDAGGAVISNVAAQANGGVASATYGGENADLVNDEQFEVVDRVNTGPFWAGNAMGDYVTVSFPENGVRQVIINTNATNNQDTSIQVSEDGENFSALSLFGGDCPLSNIGSGRIRCVFSGVRTLTAVRVEILQKANSTFIYEIRALTGTSDPDA